MANFKIYDGTGWVELLKSSDISAWAKQSTKPSYNLDEVPDGSTRKLANYLPKSGGTMTGNLTFQKNGSTIPNISFQGSQATYTMIKFLDNTGDTYGNGISIGGGGAVVIGAGESADNIVSGAGVSGGTETLYLGSDQAIYLLTNVQSGYSSAKTFTFDASGNLSVPNSISEGGTALSSKYLGISSQAADSAKLDGQAASYYAAASSIPTESTVSGWGFTKNAGTVTSVDSVSPSSGNVALSAVRYVSQSLTDAQKTQARSNIGAGTSSFTGYTSSNKLSTSYIQNDAGWTANAGTVTSVRVQAGTGLSSSTSTAQSSTLNTTISIASGYKLPTTDEWNGKQAVLPTTTTAGKVLKSTSTAGTVEWGDDNNANYYHTTGSWDGLTYTATANGGAGALAFTIPTGTSASTVCVGNDSRLSNSRTPTSHASSATTYGVGTSSNYGHVKLKYAWASDYLNGYALGINQSTSGSTTTSLSGFSDGSSTTRGQAYLKLAVTNEAPPLNISSGVGSLFLQASSNSAEYFADKIVVTSQANLASPTYYTLNLPRKDGTLATLDDILSGDTNYYPVRSYSSGLQISGYVGSTDCQLYVPYMTASQYGVAKCANVRTSSITSSSGNTYGNYYGVEKDSNGKLFVCGTKRYEHNILISKSSKVCVRFRFMSSSSTALNTYAKVRAALYNAGYDHSGYGNLLMASGIIYASNAAWNISGIGAASSDSGGIYVFCSRMSNSVANDNQFIYSSDSCSYYDYVRDLISHDSQ